MYLINRTLIIAQLSSNKCKSIAVPLSHNMNYKSRVTQTVFDTLQLSTPFQVNRE